MSALDGRSSLRTSSKPKRGRNQSAQDSLKAAKKSVESRDVDAYQSRIFSGGSPVTVERGPRERVGGNKKHSTWWCAACGEKCKFMRRLVARHPRQWRQEPAPTAVAPAIGDWCPDHRPLSLDSPCSQDQRPREPLLTRALPPVSSNHHVCRRTKQFAQHGKQNDGSCDIGHQ